jgi:hypothetical protein
MFVIVGFVLVFFEWFFFLSIKIWTEEDSTDIKSFITTGNDEKETNRDIEESECNVFKLFWGQSNKTMNSFHSLKRWRRWP